MPRRDAIEYNERVPLIYRPGPYGLPGHRRHASVMGIADRTP